MEHNVEVDLALAIQLQEQFEEELRQQQSTVSDITGISNLQILNERSSKKSTKESSDDASPLPVSLIDPVWELIDPVPDVHALFCTYNDQFFWGRLHAVSVSWSPRMTVCAGVCSYERRGGLCSIRLSVPLLKLRPRSDLIETLLHEMIHAYLFVTANNRDRDGHGPEFHKHMYRINAKAKTKITVYHSFHNEVAVYKQHVWQCNGPCRRQRPYFGLVKRSMNRAPGPNDRWWAQHQASCGGAFSKIKEPEGYSTKGGTKRKASHITGESAIKKSNVPGQTKNPDIRSFFGGVKSPTNSSTGTLDAEKINKFNHGLSMTNNKPSSNFPRPNSKTNIHGLDSTATGSLKQLNIPNASKSKIFGFDRGSSTSKNNGSSSKSGGPRGGLKMGGNGTFVLNPRASKTKIKDEESSEQEIEERKQTFIGQGYTLGGAEGSHSSEEPSRAARPMSRLVAQFDASKKKSRDGNKNSSLEDSRSNGSQRQLKQSLYDIQDSDDEDSNDNDKMSEEKECPLCNIMVPSSSFNSHIEECCGDWQLCDFSVPPLDESEGFGCSPQAAGSSNSKPEKIVAANKDKLATDIKASCESVQPSVKPKTIKSKINSSTSSKSKQSSSSKGSNSNYIEVSDSDDDFSERLHHKPIQSVVQQNKSSGTLRSNSPLVASGSKYEKKYPCPVCQEEYTEEYIISVHMNTHFS